jgi:hypothetical protein
MLAHFARPFVFLGLVIYTALPRIGIFAFAVFVGFLGPILSVKCYMPYQWGDLADRMNQSGSFREIMLAAVAVVAVVMCDILHSFSGGKVRGLASVSSMLMFLVLFTALLILLPWYASLPNNRPLEAAVLNWAAARDCILFRGQ